MGQSRIHIWAPVSWAILCTTSVLLVVWRVFGFPDGYVGYRIDISDLPEWASALGTISAAVIALFIASRQTRQMQQQQRGMTFNQRQAAQTLLFHASQIVKQAASEAASGSLTERDAARLLAIEAQMLAFDTAKLASHPIGLDYLGATHAMGYAHDHVVRCVKSGGGTKHDEWVLKDWAKDIDTQAEAIAKHWVIDLLPFSELEREQRNFMRAQRLKHKARLAAARKGSSDYSQT